MTEKVTQADFINLINRYRKFLEEQFLGSYVGAERFPVLTVEFEGDVYISVKLRCGSKCVGLFSYMFHTNERFIESNKSSYEELEKDLKKGMVDTCKDIRKALQRMADEKLINEWELYNENTIVNQAK